jgi:hypothetical protein
MILSFHVLFVRLSLKSSKLTKVQLNVTKIASADIILGSSWLRESNFFVGGTENDVIFNPVQLSTTQDTCGINQDSDLSRLMKLYSEVFVTQPLTSLPPHRKGFDCEINLKDGMVPPFGKMYNLSKQERDELKMYVDDNLRKGFIQLFPFSRGGSNFLHEGSGKGGSALCRLSKFIKFTLSWRESAWVHPTFF